MARSSSSKVRPELQLRLDRVQAVWTALTPEDWLLLLNELQPDSGFHIKSGQLCGRCFFHEGDRSPSLYVSPQKGLAKCFGAGCNKAVTSPIALVAAAGRIPQAEALLLLKRRFGLRNVLPDSAVSAFETYAEHGDCKQRVAQVLMRELETAYVALETQPDGDYAYAAPLVAWLKQRGIADPSGLPIGIIPPALHFKQALEGGGESLTAFAMKYFDAVYKSYQWIGALCFITHDDLGSVGRFKLRQPVSQDFLWIDDAYADAVGGFRGFFGLQSYAQLFGNHDIPAASSVYIVEGEFDALTPLYAQMSREVRIIALSAGGKGAQLTREALRCLRALGVSTIRIIGDNDRGGVDFAKHCLNQIPADADMRAQVMQWPAGDSDAPKDPDAWIVRYGWDTFAAWAANPQNFVPPHQWCVDRLDHDLSRISREDARQMHEAALDWARLLHHPAECRTFCERTEALFGISALLLYKDARARDEDELGFVTRITEVLAQRFCPVGVERAGTGKQLLELWDREKRGLHHVMLNDTRLTEVFLAQVYGNLTSFVDHEVGAPQFMEARDKPMPLTLRIEAYRNYTCQGVLGLIQGLPNLGHVVRKAQGYHFHSGSGDGETLSYLVNGHRLYRMRASAGSFVAEELQDPRDGQQVFLLDEEPWLTTLTDARDLQREIPPQSLFNRIESAISTGWSFKEPHRLTARFLAAYVMALPVMAAFSRQTAVMLCAESTSGKSKFVSGFVGGGNFKSIHVVACASTLSTYTAAGIRQLRNSSSRPLALEEFEDYGTHDAKSMRVRSVLELLRDMISEGEVVTTMGTQTGKTITYRLRFPVLCAAIRPLRDEASLSRFVVVELATDKTHADPTDAVQSVLGVGGVERLRHELGVGMFRYVPQLLKHYEDISAEIAASPVFKDYGSTRTREALYPALAVLRLCGIDAVRFAQEFLAARAYDAARVRAGSEGSQIVQTILDSSFQMPGEHRPVKTTIRQILETGPSGVEQLNRAGRCGVYVHLPRQWLVIVWTTAMQEVLRTSRFARDATPQYLKTICDRSDAAVAPQTIEQERLFRALRAYTGPGMHAEHCSVLDLAKLVGDLHLTPSTDPPAGPQQTPQPSTPQRPPTGPVCESLPPPETTQQDDEPFDFPPVELVLQTHGRRSTPPGAK